MKRRSVLTHLLAAGATTFTGTRAAHAQAPVPVIGFLRSTGEADSKHLVEAFRRGLAENGLVQGRNVVVEYRWGESRPDLLSKHIADLVERRVALVICNSAAGLAVKAATTTIPIVFITGEDPIRQGLVASLSRPGGNLTGVAFLDTELASKRLGMLHELTPRLATIGILVDPSAPGYEAEQRSVEEAGRSLGRRILIVRASTDAEIDAAFETMSRSGVLALFVGIGPFYNSKRVRIAGLATHHRLPAIYGLRSFAEDGGLFSYGPDQPDAYRRAAAYAARILRGAKPADLPVEMPTRYELVVNLRSAKAMGFEVPASMLAVADEVIE